MRGAIFPFITRSPDGVESRRPEGFGQTQGMTAEGLDVAQKGDADVTDTDSDDSEEIDVEDLGNDFESDNAPVPARDMSARRRLEELLEARRAARELEDFDDYDI